MAVCRLRHPIFLLAFLVGSSVETVKAQAKAESDSAENRWYVYRDAGAKENHGEWTNWMPGGTRKLIKVDVADSVNPESGATCVRIDMIWDQPFWCGIAVSSADEY